MPAPSLRLIFTPDPPKAARLKLEMYSVDLLGVLTPPRGLFGLVFTPGPKESNILRE